MYKDPQFITTPANGRNIVACMCNGMHATAANAARCAGRKRAESGDFEVRAVDEGSDQSWFLAPLIEYSYLLLQEERVRAMRDGAWVEEDVPHEC